MRREFPNKVKGLAFLRAKGCCEQCNSGVKLRTGDIFYDHILPDGLTGEPILENCQVLCRRHHDAKTREEDVPRIAKAKRVAHKHIGIRKSRSIRAWRKFDGTPVYASRER